MAKIGSYIIKVLLISTLHFTALIEAIIKNIFTIAVLKMHFLREELWGSNTEVQFLEEQFWNAFFEGAIFNNYFRWLVEMTADSQLVINVATAFFIKHFIGSKPFLILTCLNINLKLLITGCNQASYVSRGTSLDFMSPLGKSSASLGKGWEATGDCWHAMVSCTPHRCRTGVGTQR